MNMPNELSIAEQAAQWLLELREGGPREREAFAAWLKDSPRHVEEFLAVTALDRAYDDFDPRKQIAVTMGDALTVLNLPSRRRAVQRPRPRRWRHVSLAAMLVAAVAMAIVLFPHERRYATATGEQRAFELPDGSMIHLNTHSEIRVRFSDARRDIRLLSGEALFRVAPDRTRPFSVLAGRTSIEAVGTQFNVLRHGEGDATVAVLEGKIRISNPAAPSVAALNLTAGEQARVHPDGRSSREPGMDAAQVTAWRQRRLIFHKDALADIVAEFNRYNDSPRLRIDDEALKERRLTGVFDADDPESLAQFLSGDGSIRFDRDRGELIIRGN